MPMRWNNLMYWQKIGQRWHVDDYMSDQLVTLCGQPYASDKKDTNVEPPHVCKKCRAILTRRILQYGVPEIARNTAMNHL